MHQHHSSREGCFYIEISEKITSYYTQSQSVFSYSKKKIQFCLIKTMCFFTWGSILNIIALSAKADNIEGFRSGKNQTNVSNTQLYGDYTETYLNKQSERGWMYFCGLIAQKNFHEFKSIEITSFNHCITIKKLFNTSFYNLLDS